jgi:hypothetical protein
MYQVIVKRGFCWKTQTVHKSAKVPVLAEREEKEQKIIPLATSTSSNLTLFSSPRRPNQSDLSLYLSHELIVGGDKMTGDEMTEDEV